MEQEIAYLTTNNRLNYDSTSPLENNGSNTFVEIIRKEIFWTILNIFQCQIKEMTAFYISF